MSRRHYRSRSGTFRVKHDTSSEGDTHSSLIITLKVPRDSARGRSRTSRSASPAKTRSSRADTEGVDAATALFTNDEVGAFLQNWGKEIRETLHYDDLQKLAATSVANSLYRSEVIEAIKAGDQELVDSWRSLNKFCTESSFDNKNDHCLNVSKAISHLLSNILGSSIELKNNDTYRLGVSNCLYRSLGTVSKILSSGNPAWGVKRKAQRVLELLSDSIKDRACLRSLFSLGADLSPLRAGLGIEEPVGAPWI